MARLIRLLPVLIPIFRKALRNPTVRRKLGLKPVDGDGRTGRSGRR